jgi:drug/metabolite transporter (DMT)-like permease
MLIWQPFLFLFSLSLVVGINAARGATTFLVTFNMVCRSCRACRSCVGCSTMLGCVLVGSVSELIAGTAGNTKGLLLGLFSGVCFAVYTLLGRGAARSKRLSPIVILFYTYLFGTLALLAWGIITQGEHALLVSLDGSGWALLLILSLGPTLFGYLLFTVSLQYLSAAVASIFHTLEPVMTALLALFFLGRMMTALQWVGLGLIVASVISMQMATLVQSRKRPDVRLYLTSTQTVNKE